MVDHGGKRPGRSVSGGGGARREKGAPGRVRRIRVPRTGRYHLLGGKGEVREVWVVLHGYRQLAGRFLRRFRGLEDPARLIVAPEALSRFYVDPAEGRHGPKHRVGGSWMTRVEREWEIGDYVGYLDRLADVVLREIPGEGIDLRLLGFSQGAHTAARWAVLGAHPPDQLVLWGAYLPPDLDPEEAAPRLRSMDVVLVRGDGDPTTDEDRRRDEEERLRAWEVRYRMLRHPGGHEVDPGTLERLAAEPVG